MQTSTSVLCIECEKLCQLQISLFKASGIYVKEEAERLSEIIRACGWPLGNSSRHKGGDTYRNMHKTYSGSNQQTPSTEERKYTQSLNPNQEIIYN